MLGCLVLLLVCASAQPGRASRCCMESTVEELAAQMAKCDGGESAQEPRKHVMRFLPLGPQDDGDEELCMACFVQLEKDPLLHRIIVRDECGRMLLHMPKYQEMRTEYEERCRRHSYPIGLEAFENYEFSIIRVNGRKTLLGSPTFKSQASHPARAISFMTISPKRCYFKIDRQRLEIEKEKLQIEKRNVKLEAVRVFLVESQQALSESGEASCPEDGKTARAAAETEDATGRAPTSPNAGVEDKAPECNERSEDNNKGSAGTDSASDICRGAEQAGEAPGDSGEAVSVPDQDDAPPEDGDLVLDQASHEMEERSTPADKPIKKRRFSGETRADPAASTQDNKNGGCAGADSSGSGVAGPKGVMNSSGTSAVHPASSFLRGSLLVLVCALLAYSLVVRRRRSKGW